MSFLKNKNFSAQNGFGLPMVMMLIVVVCLAAVYLISRSAEVYKDQHHTAAVYQITNVINRIRTLLTDKGIAPYTLPSGRPSAWQYTYEHGTNSTTFSCLLHGTTCASYIATAPTVGTWPLASTANLIILRDTDGSTFYDSTNASAGFDSQGAACTGFSSVTPSNKCPYHVVVFWVPDSSCSGGGACTKFYIRAYTVYAPVAGSSFAFPLSPRSQFSSFGDWTRTNPIDATTQYDSSITKFTTNDLAQGYCCSIACLHQTGDSGVAFATTPVSDPKNCYPGSNEVSNTICYEALAGNHYDWYPAGTNTTPNYQGTTPSSNFYASPTTSGTSCN